MDSTHRFLFTHMVIQKLDVASYPTPGIISNSLL